MTQWLNWLDALGADHRSLRSLETESADLLPYATLTNARRQGNSILQSVGAVYEWQDAPLVFLVNAAQIQDTNDVHKLRRLLAMRGDAPYLGVVSPGRLEVYVIALDTKTPEQAKLATEEPIAAGQAFFPTLANRRPKAVQTKRGWISNVVLNLLTNSIDKLIALEINHGDAISLVGRALFARFLADRDLLPKELSTPQVAAALFDTTDSACATCQWLDNTFNGDLLPLSSALFESLPQKAYGVLGNIMRKAQGGQLFLGWAERWDQLDFAHIPVGVLSQAYELYLRSHEPTKQRKEGGFYTPRPIADLLVRASFRAVERNGCSAEARILDPAAGAGIFLLSAFRELVAARWRADGKRPDTQCLREILYDQIAGFDVNEEALRFAALALYLISIELDPEPQPVDKLRFDDLRGNVLHLMVGPDDQPGANLGSLGPLVSDEHKGRYDMVVGNPPWATGTKLRDWSLVLQEVARIASERQEAEIAPPLPNEVLDVPFVWRAMEWAKPGGQIAFALHARLLFQQGDGMAGARQALFQALDVTSVINGVELRQTKVWPEITAPFCLLLATNQRPAVGAGFRLISPRLESDLNSAGVMRIDAQSAEIVATQHMIQTPELLKALFRGSKTDVGLLERLRAKGFPTLESFWLEAVGVSSRGRLAGAGRGYQTLKPSSRTRKNGDGLPGVDAGYLRGLPDVTIASLDNVVIDAAQLDTFQHARIHDPRDPRLFAAPTAVVHKVPSAEHGRIRVAVSYSPVAYNENFYGYSGGNMPDAELFSRYLALVLGSKLALWLALMTSGEFGFEREVVEKAALDRIPLPDFRGFEASRRLEIDLLFEGLQQSSETWNVVDGWVAELYGLGPIDLQTIADTLDYNLPFAKNKAAAQTRPDAEMVGFFCASLQEELAPWAKRLNTKIRVSPVHCPGTSPWLGIHLGTHANAMNAIDDADWQGLLSIADASAASELLVEDPGGGLFIGRLAQSRYWSTTQARLLAQHIVWSHLNVLKGPARG